MVREQRFRFVGIVFYIIFLANLLLSQKGSLLAYNLLSDADQFQATAGLVGLGVLFFTSEAIGYIFGSVIRFFWTIWGWPKNGGYSTEWRKKLSKDLREEILKKFEEACDSENPTRFNTKVRNRLRGYRRDVFLSYFWQQAPDSLVVWASRRNTAFFAGWSSILGIGLALLSTMGIIGLFEMNWTTGNTCLLVVAILVMGAIGFITEFARKEAWQIVDLWLCRAFSPELDGAMEEVADHLSSERDEE